MDDLIEFKPKDIIKSGVSVKLDLRKYWTPQQINSAIDRCSNGNDAMLLRFLWMSGLRITETTNLKKGDIDFQNYVMTVRWLKNRKYNERVVPIHPTLKTLLQMFTAPLNLDDRLFPYTRQRAWQIVKKWMNGHPHQFRHSFAVNWLRNDGDIVILHRILGHSKIQTTMEYLKIVPIDQGKELLKIKFD